MNFYKHYIGDFQRDTGHLSLTQRGAYLCLMHHYYATEKPLPNDHAALCRIAGAIDKAEREAVRVVMAFFTPVESGLLHQRIEAELHKAGKQADTNRRIAIEREAARREERERHEQSTKRATNREPNQTPDTREKKTPKPPAGGSARFPEFWSVWPSSLRKGGKSECERLWQAKQLDGEADAIVAHVVVMAASVDWRKEGGQFVPKPITYLRGRGWDGSEPVNGHAASAIFEGAL